MIRAYSTGLERKCKLTGNPNAQLVDDNSNQAQIAAAIVCNGQTVQEMGVHESVIATEKKNVEAQSPAHLSAGGGVSLSGRALGVRLSGSNRAAVLGDVAFEACGLGPLAQAGKMVLDTIGQYNDLGISTNAFIGSSTNSSKSKGPKGSIHTKPFNDLFARSKGMNDFTQGDGKVKGVKSTEASAATLTKQLEQICSAKMLSALHLGNAKAMELKAGAKIAKAQQLGIAPSALNLNGMSGGPKGYTLPKKIIDDGSGELGIGE